ncbi:MAG: DUF1570 domain-containing protein [Isosphaeraceae bacterium]
MKRTLASMRWSWRALVLVALLSRPCFAELLYFVQGGRIQAPCTVKDGRVRIETPIGPHVFLETDFLKIVPGGCPELDWATRSQVALRGGVKDRLGAAWWALENGLIPESVAMIRAARKSDPADRLAARLGGMLDQLDRECGDTETETDRLRRALQVPCQEIRGPHILLLHQHDPSEARERLDFLENVFRAYYLWFAAQGVDLSVPRHRVVSVYLRDQKDYLAFLRSQNAGAFRTTLGYYHPNFRAVVSHDARSPARRNQTSAIASDRPDVPQPESDPRLFLRKLADRARDHGTAAHEMVHLLVVESGLATRPGEFPLWLHEGFAAQFEVVRGGRWAGVGRAHDLRLPDWRALSAPSPLSSIIHDEGFGRGYRHGLYARSWSLVYFLRKTRPREFLAFIDLLRAPPSGNETSDSSRFERIFKASFGSDLEGLEKEWHAFMSRVQTPLEENAPGR